ncbi:sulfate transporter [Pseudoxanthomonas jiangsuensis]|uniref:DUF3164 family protein n=1 Tax=Pseudoxanthomonas jiangsuensis TaxID=619688 RepID=UPI001391D704|nr:DUF3164 family protein [Pseudoxanthomonas jiangsuensis]KAF1692738.1 sulfate transporter [Pseudoxanthomonas jiangsuensis]
MSTTEPDTIPPGYRKDRNGRLIPEQQIRAVDLERDALVVDVVGKAKGLREQLAAFKREVFDNITALVQLSAEQYKARVGGNKGNVTLFSFDGQYKVIRAIQESLAFDERLQAAKALIDECLDEWTEGSRSELVALINSAFRVDQDGNIKTAQVLTLRNLSIEDDRWQRAMAAISDALTVVGSKTYVRIYERDANGLYQPISLDLAVV